jgi:tetratricopeptide (TPR) repeat protein
VRSAFSFLMETNHPPPAAAAAAPESRIEAELQRIRALMERGQLAPALDQAQALRAEVPENRDVLYVVAVCQRYLNQIPLALGTLAELERLHPNYSRLFQERGHCYTAQRAAQPAIEAFLRAVNLNPALPASWKSLQALYRITGQVQQAATAASHVDTLARLPVEVVTASSMLADGELQPAERIIRPFLLQHGDHVEGMRVLAKIGMKVGVLDDAETLLERLLELAPDYQAARYDYVRVLLDRHRDAKAVSELETLLKTDPSNRSYRAAAASARVGMGDAEGAVRGYRELLAETPQAPELHLSVAHALKTLGQSAEAVEAYRTAARLRPNYGDAYWSLANLKTYRFADEELARMRAEESAPGTGQEDRFHLCFALGKALEDRGEYPESFQYYARGNALKKAQSGYRARVIERNARLQAQICTAEFFAARPAFGATSDAPIFVVGLPRSGSTLIEQILASHSQVEGTMELAEIPRLVGELQGREFQDDAPRYPGILRELSAADCAALGERYLEATRIYRQGKARFIDKMPNNFRHIGLIHLILPHARIIDARRDPLACCFSNFKQLFASGQEFTYSLEDIGDYYRWYVQLMAHWDAVLPGRVLRVEYEALVADLEGQVRRMLAFLGLEFEPQCLTFYKTERSVRTASSEQVRRPLYREGIDQWRHFDPWLGPLRQSLGELAAADAT